MRWLAVLVAVAAGVAGPLPAAGGGDLPPGLVAFLDARAAEAAGDVARALELYRKALEAEPGNLEIRVSLAALQVDLGRGEAALELLEGREPELGWYGRRTRALALAQAARGDRELLGRAVEALRDVASARPDDGQVQVELARALLAAGETGEAERVIASIRRYRPGNPRLAILHARALRALGRIEEAESVLQGCSGHGGGGFFPCVEELERLYLDTGRPAEAGELLLRTAGEGDVDRLVQAASHLLDGGRPDRALKALSRARERAPDEPRVAMLEASALESMGRLRQALARLERFVREHPDEAGPHLVLASLYADARRLEDARRELQAAWRAAGDEGRSPVGIQVCLAAARIELRAGRPGVAREWLARIGMPRLAGRELPMLLAETYRRRREYREGVAALLRLEPALAPEARWVAVALEGELRLRDGDSRGLGALERAVERGPLAGALTAVDALQSLERWEDALRLASRALERFPGHRGLRFARAASLERLGRFEDAAAAFEELLEEDPGDAAVANYLGYMWADRGVELERALELIRRAVEAAPGVPAYLDSLGWVHYRLGNLDEAERWLRRAVRLGGGRDGTVLAHLGEVLAARGQVEEARRHLRRALDLGCEHPERVRELLRELGDGSR